MSGGLRSLFKNSISEMTLAPESFELVCMISFWLSGLQPRWHTGASAKGLTGTLARWLVGMPVWFDSQAYAC